MMHSVWSSGEGLKYWKRPAEAAEVESERLYFSRAGAGATQLFRVLHPVRHDSDQRYPFIFNVFAKGRVCPLTPLYVARFHSAPPQLPPPLGPPQSSETRNCPTPNGWRIRVWQPAFDMTSMALNRLHLACLAHPKPTNWAAFGGRSARGRWVCTAGCE